VRIYSASDLGGVGLATAVAKSGTSVEPKHTLNVWVRGEMAQDTLDLTTSEAKAVMQALARAMPWAVVEDVSVFDKRWTADREACARDLDDRRKAASAGPGRPQR
jgi:hypothetical protein